MLLKVALSEDTFADLEDLSPRRVEAIGRLVRDLRTSSIFVVGSDQTKAKLIRSLRACHAPEVAMALEKLLTDRSEVAADLLKLEDIEEAAELAKLADIAPLVVLRELQIDLLEGTLPAAPEVQDIERIATSKSLLAIQQSWAAQVPKGTDRDAVWTGRFEPFARRHPRVYIVEEHAGQDLWNAMGDEVRSPRRTPRGCLWFLDRLQRSGVRHVSVATEERSLANSSINAVELATRLDSRFPRMTVELWTAPPRVELHRRRIAFDGWVGFEIHKGMATFDRKQLGESLGCQPNHTLVKDVRASFRDFCRVPRDQTS